MSAPVRTPVAGGWRYRTSIGAVSPALESAFQSPAEESRLTLGALLRYGRKYLAERRLEEAALEAEVLLMHQAGVSRAYLHSHPEEPVGPEDRAAYQALLDRRATREPLAYITGTREFFGLEFYVDRRVLIPRPETEMVVEECLRSLRQGDARSHLIADIGTGSGAVAVALAYHLPNARIYATDVSSQALEIASLNSDRYGMEKRVTLLQGSLLEPLPEPVDAIVANLPYVPSSVIANLEPEVSAYEPRLALDGGEDGLDHIRQLLAQAPARLQPGGLMLLEIGAGQGKEAARAASDAIPGSEERIVQDLAGLDRMLVVTVGS